jgi:ferredoxin
MKRDIIKIDEELCDGCGLCIPNCHEGALKVIDGKARLISDLMCDGLGACIGHCPQGAITIENREAAEYDEIAVMEEMVKKGQNTVIAHLSHLKDHNETGFLKQGVDYLRNNSENIEFDVDEAIWKVHNQSGGCKSGACPGSAEKVFEKETYHEPVTGDIRSELTHWPVQLHLINPVAEHFRGSDLLIAADCTAFTYGGFHRDFLKNKKVIIACPKLDTNLGVYVEKIHKMIDEAKVNTITVVIMEVPCCSGLLRIVQESMNMSARKVPVKLVVISSRGEILNDEWI